MKIATVMGGGEPSDLKEEATPNQEAMLERCYSLWCGKELVREMPADKMGKRKAVLPPHRDGGLSVRDLPSHQC